MVAIENKRITFSALIFLSLLLWFSKSDCNNDKSWLYVPFKESMAKVGNCYEKFIRKGRRRYRHIDLGLTNGEVFHFFKTLYEANIKNIHQQDKKTILRQASTFAPPTPIRLRQGLDGQGLRRAGNASNFAKLRTGCQAHDERATAERDKKQGNIPKIIHQIWLGSELPERYKKLAETWKNHHPDWEYRLWTDEDAKMFDLHNRDLFEESTNYAEKSDILRYEILYQYGGLYVDTDFECFKNFDILNERFQFYCGCEPIAKVIMLGNALIASVAGNPILKHCIEQMKSNVEQINNRWKRGKKKWLQICLKTGPHYFTKVFIEAVKMLSKQDYENVIVFPASYFYPKYFNVPTVQVFDESFGVHLWDSTWLG